jgi:hypothetical protein
MWVMLVGNKPDLLDLHVVTEAGGSKPFSCSRPPRRVRRMQILTLAAEHQNGHCAPADVRHCDLAVAKTDQTLTFI